MGAPSLDATIFTADIVDEVRRCIDENIAAGTIVTGNGQVQTLLIDAGIARHCEVPPEIMGVHPDNRDEHGVGGSEAHFLGAQILDVGYSAKRAENGAVAFECPPAPWNEAPEAFNKSIVDLSTGLIPALQRLAYLSVGASHTNSFLRAVKAGCRTCVETLNEQCGGSCNLNQHALTQRRPEFQRALSNGIKFLCIHWQAQFAWPDLPRFLQSSKNAEVKGQQSEIEILLRLHTGMMFHVKQKSEPGWDEIEAHATRSMPTCKAWIKPMSAFVKKYSGGERAPLLHELSRFQRAFGCNEAGATRTLGSEFFIKLMGLPFRPGAAYPLVVTSAIKANLISPANKVVDGRCVLITPTDLSKLGQKKRSSSQRSRRHDDKCAADRRLDRSG